MIMETPFTYQYYEKMLRKSLENDYKITSFEKFDKNNPKTIIMRHDVDYTLNGVYELAQIESDLGCTASYLFRIHADEYNLFSCTSWAIADKVKSLGHEVGLHFECMNVGRALKIPPEELLVREKTIAENILGQKIKTCSEHRELSGAIHGTSLFDEKYNPYDFGFEFYAMDPKYSKEMKYLSDSNANWREGDLLEHLNKFDRFQVLVHPDWWFKDDLLLKGPYYHPRGTHI